MSKIPQSEDTHWVIVKLTKEDLNAGDPRLPGRLQSKAEAEFKKLGKLVGVPHFLRYHDGPLILPDGRLWNGPGAIYLGQVEVKDGKGKQEGN